MQADAAVSSETTRVYDTADIAAYLIIRA